MFRLNGVLRDHGLPPEDTVVLLHSPRERRLAQLLPFLAESSPEVLEAFQSVHSARATETIRGRGFMVSFVRVYTGRLAFVGAFRTKSVERRPTREICADPAMRRVIDEFGANTPLEAADVFDWDYCSFERLPVLADYIGRLQIAPRLTPTYARLADRLDAQIVELTVSSVLAPAPPDWRDFIVTGPELHTLPEPWAARLREWRGIYLIVDQTDGARYVGAAYGQENLLGRWRDHVAGHQGVTAELRRRDPRDFRFSVLERVSPDASPEDVVAIERSWMARLDTQEHGLNR